MIETMLEKSRDEHDEKQAYHDTPRLPEGKEVARGVYKVGGMIYVGDKL